MTANDRRAGFLLLEVLAALLVTAAFVVVVLPFAGRLATRWWSGETVVEGADAWMQGIARLSDDVAEAVPVVAPLGGTALAFRATSTGLVFVRPALGRSAAGLETVTVSIVPKGSGVALVRRARPFDPEDFASEPHGAGAATTLLEGRFRPRFASVGRDGVRHDRWGDPNNLPLRLELSVATTDGQPLFPSTIVLPIPARAGEGRVAGQAPSSRASPP